MSTKHASDPSKYEHMTIDKNGERVNFVNLDKKITINNFSYYESLLHPNVTANIIYTDFKTIENFYKVFVKGKIITEANLFFDLAKISWF